MKIRIRREWHLCLAFLLITLSWSKASIYYGFDEILEYSGLFLILVDIYLRKNVLGDKRVIEHLIFCMLFFSVGLCIQNLGLLKIIRLIISMFILASIALVPCQPLSSLEGLKNISKSIIAGLIASMVFAVLTGKSLITSASEGIFVNYGFDAGITHRNYFAYILLCVFLTYFVSYKINRNKKDLFISGLVGLLLLTANSRSADIILLLFLIIANMDRIKGAKRKLYSYVLLMVVVLLLTGPLLLRLLNKYSENFHFRINGLNNYISMYSNDCHHLIFGNAEMAFGNGGNTYDENIRSVIGWNGSTELVVLNVLIKNGLLGFMGYFLIFKKIIQECRLLSSNRVKLIGYALIITFLITSLVEAYVADIKQVYTVFMYLLMCNLKSISAARYDSREMGRCP